MAVEKCHVYLFIIACSFEIAHVNHVNRHSIQDECTHCEILAGERFLSFLRSLAAVVFVPDSLMQRQFFKAVVSFIHRVLSPPEGFE